MQACHLIVRFDAGLLLHHHAEHGAAEEFARTTAHFAEITFIDGIAPRTAAPRERRRGSSAPTSSRVWARNQFEQRKRRGR